MTKLIQAIQENQKWLLFNLNRTANECGYGQVFSSRPAAWKRCIAEVSDLFIENLNAEQNIGPVQLGENLHSDVIAAYGIKQAEVHARFKLPIATFLGGLKCFSRAFAELVDRTSMSAEERQICWQLVKNFFDRIELGFCSAWEKKLITLPDLDSAYSAEGA